MSKLQEVRDLISLPERWTKTFFARNAQGEGLWHEDSGAVCWCLTGACAKVDGDIFGSTHTALKARLTSGEMSWFNDNHTHAEVLAFLDAAIAAEASC